MWGANRLAFEAFPLFPVWPSIRRVETAGFVTSGSLNTYFYWSLWEQPLSLPSVRSLLWQRDWHRFKEPERQSLGIGPTYRAQRFNFGKYRNFAPGEALGGSRETRVVHHGKRVPLLRK